MILGCSPTMVLLACVLSTGVVLSDTSLLDKSQRLFTQSTKYRVLESPGEGEVHLLDDDKDLYAVLGFTFEEIVKSESLVSWSTEV